jgi:hypothetical protein
MTKQESLVLSAYTGYMLCKDFSEFHKYIEQVMERPVFTHELADDRFTKELSDKVKPDMLHIIKNIGENSGKEKEIY